MAELQVPTITGWVLLWAIRAYDIFDLVINRLQWRYNISHGDFVLRRLVAIIVLSFLTGYPRNLRTATATWTRSSRLTRRPRHTRWTRWTLQNQAITIHQYINIWSISTFKVKEQSSFARILTRQNLMLIIFTEVWNQDWFLFKRTFTWLGLQFFGFQTGLFPSTVVHVVGEELQIVPYYSLKIMERMWPTSQAGAGPNPTHTALRWQCKRVSSECIIYRCCVFFRGCSWEGGGLEKRWDRWRPLLLDPILCVGLYGPTPRLSPLHWQKSHCKGN